MNKGTQVEVLRDCYYHDAPEVLRLKAGTRGRVRYQTDKTLVCNWTGHLGPVYCFASEIKVLA